MHLLWLLLRYLSKTVQVITVCRDLDKSFKSTYIRTNRYNKPTATQFLVIPHYTSRPLAMMLAHQFFCVCMRGKKRTHFIALPLWWRICCGHIPKVRSSFTTLQPPPARALCPGISTMRIFRTVSRNRDVTVGIKLRRPQHLLTVNEYLWPQLYSFGIDILKVYGDSSRSSVGWDNWINGRVINSLISKGMGNTTKHRSLAKIVLAFHEKVKIVKNLTYVLWQYLPSYPTLP